ncbi:MAG: hypothetical protein FLDDKLPJ_02614 [Phycisphaerae bacterium]|nr:hypothetical protein [Phycisphaerae bacterium]
MSQAALSDRTPGTSKPARLKRSRIRNLVLGALLVASALSGLEIVLRLLGWPRGTFRGAFSTSTGIWEPGYDAVLELGPFSYRVQANAMGFRGPELRSGFHAARLRIVCLGDSVTDGFYVDNPDTYPVILNDLLNERGRDVEVINAARGGGSINKALVILRDRVLALKPDIAVLTFVTNDLADLRGRSPRELTSVSLEDGGTTPWIETLLTRCAIAESVTDLALRLRSPNYRREERSGGRLADRPDRYDIPGNDRYEDNARTFLELWKDVDGRLLRESLDDEMSHALDSYCDILRELARLCHENDIRLLFAYFPAYPEVYLAECPDVFRRTLRARVEAQGVEFVDLTPALRDGSRDGPLHLAPIDFHPNPRGYRVIATAIADRLEELQWLAD